MSTNTSVNTSQIPSHSIIEVPEHKTVSKSSQLTTSSHATIAPRRLYTIIIGLCLLFFISALDTTILATVFIDISSQYQDMSNGIWIITSYLLATTAVQPLFGKFSDILGRYEAILAATLVFCLGSVLCAVSNSMGMLIASRAIQGIGGGGLLTMVSVVMGDITSERDRGKYTGYLAASWGVASAIGPVLGGAIVQNGSWRIVFWINLPVCLPSLIVLYFALRIPRPRGSVIEKIKRMDLLGALAFQAFIIPMIIAFAWGGQGYSWVSARVLGTIGGATLMGLIFLLIEWKVSKEPIVPLRLFKIQNVVASSLGHLGLGACIYAPLFFIPTWEISVKHSSEVNAGLHLLPLMGCMVVAAAAAGAIMVRFGHYRPLIWGCGVLVAVGNSLLILLTPDSNNGERIGFLVITGIGFGLGVQTLTIAAQCAVDGMDMAATTTLMLFLRTLGGILSLSVLSSILNNMLRSDAIQLVGEFPKYQAAIMQSLNDQSAINQSGVPVEIKQRLTGIFQNALHRVFVMMTPFSGVLVLSTVLFSHVSLNQRRRKTYK